MYTTNCSVLSDPHSHLIVELWGCRLQRHGQGCITHDVPHPAHRRRQHQQNGVVVWVESEVKGTWWGGQRADGCWECALTQRECEHIGGGCALSNAGPVYRCSCRADQHGVAGRGPCAHSVGVQAHWWGWRPQRCRPSPRVLLQGSPAWCSRTWAMCSLTGSASTLVEGAPCSGPCQAQCECACIPVGSGKHGVAGRWLAAQIRAISKCRLLLYIQSWLVTRMPRISCSLLSSTTPMCYDYKVIIRYALPTSL